MGNSGILKLDEYYGIGQARSDRLMADLGRGIGCMVLKGSEGKVDGCKRAEVQIEYICRFHH